MATNKFEIQQNGPHLGQMVAKRIKKRRISKAAISRKMNRASQTVHGYIQRHSLQTEILWEICIAMKHNFFQDFAAQLPSEFTTNAPDPTLPLLEKIENLKRENELPNAKIETLTVVVRETIAFRVVWRYI